MLTTSIVIFSILICVAQKERTQEEKLLFDSIKQINSKVNNYIRNVSNLDSAKILSNQAIRWSSIYGYPKGKVSALCNLGSVYFYLGKVDSAVYFNEQALKLSKENDLDSLTSIVSNTLGVFYRHLGKYGMAMNAHLLALSIEERNLNQHGLWRVLVNLTALYDQIGDYEKSLESGLRSIEAADTIKTRLMRSYVNVGIAYLNLERYAESILNTKRALDISTRIENSSIKISCIINLTNSYLALNSLDSAMYYGKLAYQLSAKSNSSTRVNSLVNYGVIFLKNKKFDSSIHHLIEARKIALNIEDRSDLANIQSQLSKAYAGKNNFKLAYLYADSARILTNELKNQDVIKTIQNSISSYELIKKENELKQAETDKKIAEVELAGQKKLTISLIACSAVLTLAASILYYLLRRIRKAERIIRQNNIELQSKNEIIQLANAELTEKTMRNQLNPHFIFNCLNTMNYLLLKNDKEDAQIYLSKFSYLLRRILESTDRPSISVAEEIEIIQIYVKLESLRFDDSINLLIDTESFDPEEVYIPPLLTQPILENAIHHGLSSKIGEKNILIRFVLENNLLKCSITDNGVGRGKKVAETFGNKRESKGVKLTATRLASYNQHIKEHAIVTTDLFDGNNKPCGTRVELELSV